MILFSCLVFFLYIICEKRDKTYDSRSLPMITSTLLMLLESSAKRTRSAYSGTISRHVTCPFGPTAEDDCVMFHQTSKFLDKRGDVMQIKGGREDIQPCLRSHISTDLENNGFASDLNRKVMET